jgi:hypothetical protein
MDAPNCHLAHMVPQMQKPLLDDPPAYIYALLDPRSQTIRYIGRTIQPSIRLAYHCAGLSGPRLTHWIRGLQTRGLRPLQQILETTVQSEAKWREYCWIRRYRRTGRLLNGMYARGKKLAPKRIKNYFQLPIDKLLS